ncbi:MAG: cysteine hydrolase family protein [Kiloniellales bacterium]
MAHTLREVAGLDAVPGRLGESAVVMIDCQNTYRQGVMQLVGVEAALQQGQRLLQRAREAGTPIIHIAHDSGPGSPYDIRAEIGQIADLVAPQEGEPTVIKHKPNSFVGTDLHECLQALGRQSVIFAGFMTHMCVNSTVRGAFNLGYHSTVVGGATATRDLPATDGGVIDAQSLQRASLAALGDLFGVVVGSVEDLSD